MIVVIIIIVVVVIVAAAIASPKLKLESRHSRSQRSKEKHLVFCVREKSVVSPKKHAKKFTKSQKSEFFGEKKYPRQH